MALYNVFVDHLAEEISSRVMSNQDRFCAQMLMPSKIRDLNDEHINAIYASYSEDMNMSEEHSVVKIDAGGSGGHKMRQDQGH